MYFNTSTYNTYRCTVAGNASTAKWVYTANIKGQAGTNGVSITGVEHQYYLSTSSTSQADGSWTVKPATYVKGRYYWERWKISFSSGDPTYTTATLAEEVTSAWVAIEQNDEAIALKANSSDVYTKTTVDEKITQEVTDRNAAITTKANEINLSVAEKVYQSAQPNLSPYFSSTPYDAVNTYWKSIQLGNGFTFTSMGDGWIRVQCTNSGSSVIRRDWYPIKCPSVVVGQPYTWLAEVRNNASSSVSSNSDFYLVQTSNLQFWGQKAIKTIEGPSGSSMSVNIGTCGSTYTLRKVQNAETASDGHWTNNDETNVVGLACWTFRCAANSTIDYEVRLSLYEGEYTGPYKPYSGTQLYASQAELKVANDSISSKVSTTDYNGQTIASLINQSAESVKIQASKVEIDGTAIFTAISSNVDDAITGKGYQTSPQVESAITSKGYATTAQAQGYADAVQDNLNASRT